MFTIAKQLLLLITYYVFALHIVHEINNDKDNFPAAKPSFFGFHIFF